MVLGRKDRQDLRAPLRYFGAKGRLAPWIAALIPPHRVYVEPFAGTAAVLLAKPPATIEILNDIDEDVVAFFRVLRERPNDLVRVCELTPYARSEFAASRRSTLEVGELEQARLFWVRTAQSVSGTGHGWSVTTARTQSPAATAISMVDRMWDVAQRLRRVQIECRPAVRVIADYGVADGVIYADPPYLGRTRRGGAGANGRDYRREMAGEDEHRSLAEALHHTPATVLLSGYPSVLYDQLYRDWFRI